MSETNKKEAANKEKLIPLTARHHESSYAAISELAKEFRIGKAVVVRMSTAGHLEKYLGSVRFLNEEQGRTINENIVTLGNLLSDTRNELRRIGVNYNQEIKLRNIAKQIAEEKEAFKKREKYADFDDKMKHIETIDKLEKAMELLKSSASDLSKKELEQLMQRYENATEHLCKVLSKLVS